MYRADLQRASRPQRIYFLGIAGTAMASLAAMLKSQGYQVWGVDEHTYPPMDAFLAERDIPVYEGYDEAHLDDEPELVVVGNALSRGNPEVEAVLNRGIPYASFPEVLREYFIRGRTSVVVAGTHGKTTTSSLIAWLLESAGRDPGFLIGGIAHNFGQGYKVGSGDVFVVEGDEYDTAFFDKGPKFLHYLPRVLVVTTIEFDHADIYRDLEEILTGFRRLVNVVPGNGLLVGWAEDEHVRALFGRAFCPVASFGSGADWQARDVRIGPEVTEFEAHFKGERFGRFRMKLFGEHNVRNALAAVAVARHLGLDATEIAEGLATFEGVKRRMEIRGEVNGVLVVDDFGHHPTEVRETLRAARRRFEGRRIWALFEPRTATSRRAIFQKAYAEALSEADLVVIAPVHRPDKVGNDRRLDVLDLASDIVQRGGNAWAERSIEAVAERVLSGVRRGDVIIAFSNGSFGGIHDKLLREIPSRIRD